MATVADLTAVAKQDEGRFHKRQLSDVSIARAETLKIGDLSINLDEEGLDALGVYLGIPRGYLKKVSPHLADENIRYFLSEDADSLALFETDGHSLLGVYDANREIIPRGRVIEVIQSVMKPDDTLNDIDLTQGRLIVDVTSATITTEPHAGDYTHGGLRFSSHIAPSSAKAKQPRVSCFMNRLLCTNGMTHDEEFGEIRIKGNTVEDILIEMEQVAEHLLENQVPLLVERFGGLTQKFVSNPEQYIHRLVKQYGLKAALESQLIERLPTLGDNPTIYDIVNLVSGFQHEEGVQRQTALRLQHLAGETAWGSDDEHRCPTCQTPLDA